ncbi:MAG: YigZ family protein [Desulfovibrio sp.]|nr:YigZ family protein [Desulfovibrio sp.]
MTRFDVPDASPERPHCTELVIRRSRFLAQCAHTPGPQAARAFVEHIRRRHADATHNCWAYAAGAPGDTAQIGSSDDGEPHGTAGRPMLQIVLHSDVGETCVVVSRWFGGVKLGTGGLVRAYQDSVRENLATLPLRRRVQETRLRLVLAYAHLDDLRRLLPAYEARIDTEDYQAEARLLLRLPEEHAAAFTAALAGLSNGAALCESVPEDG